MSDTVTWTTVTQAFLPLAKEESRDTVGTDTIDFLGAGKSNVVVGLPAGLFASSATFIALQRASRSSKDAAAHRVALRIHKGTPKECEECYRTLKAYAGDREMVSLPINLSRAIQGVVPVTYHTLLRSVSVATLLPNFANDPAQLLRGARCADDNLGGMADYTVEVKPKGAWQRPHVVGIVVDGTVHGLEEVKLHQCRYAQMLRFKNMRCGSAKPIESTTIADTGGSYQCNRATSTGEGVAPYCPNILFRPTLSSREGLRRLRQNPKNNLRLLHSSSSRWGKHLDRLDRLTEEEFNGIADAIDASGVLAPLAHLQLYGCAPLSDCASPEAATSNEISVLDIVLLYYWSKARDKEGVQWIVTGAAQEFSCSCTSSSSSDAPANISRVDGARRVAPTLSFAECLERFYVSTTAKDVSIMVAVSNTSDAPGLSEGTFKVLHDVVEGVSGCFVSGGGRLYRIGVVDLDSKTHKSLESYFQQDKDIVDAFAKQA